MRESVLSGDGLRAFEASTEALLVVVVVLLLAAAVPWSSCLASTISGKTTSCLSEVGPGVRTVFSLSVVAFRIMEPTAREIDFLSFSTPGSRDDDLPSIAELVKVGGGATDACPVRLVFLPGEVRFCSPADSSPVWGEAMPRLDELACRR